MVAICSIDVQIDLTNIIGTEQTKLQHLIINIGLSLLELVNVQQPRPRFATQCIGNTCYKILEMCCTRKNLTKQTFIHSRTKLFTDEVFVELTKLFPVLQHSYPFAPAFHFLCYYLEIKMMSQGFLKQLNTNLGFKNRQFFW